MLALESSAASLISVLSEKTGLYEVRVPRIHVTQALISEKFSFVFNQKLTKDFGSFLLLDSNSVAWFVGDTNASLIVSESEEASLSLLPKSTKNIPDSVRDDLVQPDILTSYPNGEFIKRIKQLIASKKKNSSWKCGDCKALITKDRSIICDRCLIWSHYKCSGLKGKPSGNWFCEICVASFAGIYHMYFCMYYVYISYVSYVFFISAFDYFS